MERHLKIEAGDAAVLTTGAFLTESETQELVEAEVAASARILHHQLAQLQLDEGRRFRRIWLANIVLLSSVLILPLGFAIALLAAAALIAMPKPRYFSQMKEDFSAFHCID